MIQGYDFKGQIGEKDRKNRGMMVLKNKCSKGGKIHCMSEGTRPSDVARVFGSWVGQW